MSFRKLSYLLVGVFAFVLANRVASFAQVTTADLSGHVLDQSGARVPGAGVTVRRRNTGATRSTKTEAEGTYSFIGLAHGTYNLTVEASGFKPVTNLPIGLTV